MKAVFNYEFQPEPTVQDLKRMLHDVIHSEETTAMELDVHGNFRPLTADPYPYFGFIPMVGRSALHLLGVHHVGSLLTAST